MSAFGIKFKVQVWGFGLQFWALGLEAFWVYRLWLGASWRGSSLLKHAMGKLLGYPVLAYLGLELYSTCTGGT